MREFKIVELTKEFISKATFLSFHGLTGESRKTLDARLSLYPQVVSWETSGMTYKEVVCDVTIDNALNADTLSLRARRAWQSRLIEIAEPIQSLT